MRSLPPTSSLPPLDPASTQALLGVIFENAQEAIAIASGGVVRVVNGPLLELFGFQTELEAVGRRFEALLAPSAAPPIGPGPVRTRMVKGDGRQFDVEVRTTVFTHRGEECAILFLRDLCPQLEVERANRESQELYRAIFETNTAVKLLIDPEDGRIVDANPAAVEFYGWPREALRAMRISEINTLSPGEVAGEMADARAGRRVYFRFKHRVATGEIRHVEVHSGRVRLGGRDLLLSIVQDVSERDALGERLRQASELEAIGRLAGGVAHDFNNLLTVITASGQLLGRALPPGQKARDHLEDILHAAARASELTRQLLAFGGRQLLAPRPVQLNDVVEGVAGLLRRTLGQRVRLEIRLTRDLPRARCDAGQIEQVLMNLAINARDAMSGAGRIEISTDCRSERVALVVRDDGPGMDEATRSRVFEPFFTTKALGQGTGLGLATAYGIVTQSGGSIGVESQPGLGATFTVLLPVA